MKKMEGVKEQDLGGLLSRQIARSLDIVIKRRHLKARVEWM